MPKADSPPENYASSEMRPGVRGAHPPLEWGRVSAESAGDPCTPYAGFRAWIKYIGVKMAGRHTHSHI